MKKYLFLLPILSVFFLIAIPASSVFAYQISANDYWSRYGGQFYNDYYGGCCNYPYYGSNQPYNYSYNYYNGCGLNYCNNYPYYQNYSYLYNYSWPRSWIYYGN